MIQVRWASSRSCTASRSSSCGSAQGPTSPSSCATARGFVPEPNTTIRRGDQLLIVATAETKARVEQRMRAVSQAGRLAGWRNDA